MQTAHEVVNAAWNRGLTPPPVLSVSQWADQNRWLSTAVTSAPGEWRTDRVPYMRQIMDCLSPFSAIRIVDFMKASQIGATESSLNWVGYVIDRTPAMMMIVLPTLDTAKEWSRQRLAQLVDDTKCLRDKVQPVSKKNSGNTILEKKFVGGFLKIGWSSSARKLASTPAAYLLLDEVDRFDGDSQGEGDPVALLERRFTNYPRGKMFRASTPTLAAGSRIARGFAQGDQRYYFVPCPTCGHFQRLVFAQLKFTPVRYHCIACGDGIPERFKTQMLAQGLHVATRDESELAAGGFDSKSEVESILSRMELEQHASFHISALYSPIGWYSWSSLTNDWRAAQSDRLRLKVFVNTVLGETWSDPGERPQWEVLKGRSEDYVVGDEAVVPMAASFLTAAVDFQKDWCLVELKAWGRGRENWSLGMWRVEEFDGNGNLLQTSDPKYREWLHSFLMDRTWRHECGVDLPIIAMGADTGTMPEPVYTFAHSHPRPLYGPTGVVVKNARTWVPLKGASTQEQHQRLIIKVSDESAAKKRLGVRIVSVGGGYAKQGFYETLKLSRNSDETYPSGYCHYSRNYQDEVFQGLCSEQRVAHEGGSIEWVKIFDRNEPLDLHVYNWAVAALIGIETFSERHWAEIDRQYRIERVEVAHTPVSVATSDQPKHEHASARSRIFGRFRG